MLLKLSKDCRLAVSMMTSGWASDPRISIMKLSLITRLWEEGQSEIKEMVGFDNLEDSVQ